MEKTIKISGRDVSFKSSGGFLVRYKAQFKRDGLVDILRLIGSFDAETQQIINYEMLDLEVFYNIVWTLAKTADPAIPDPMTWYDSFDEFPIIDVIGELQELIISSIASSKKN